MISQKRFGWLVLVILACSFGIRLAAACYWQKQLHSEGKALRFGDSDSYWVLSNRIASGEAYEYSGENSKIFRAPLYPLMLAPVAKIGRLEVFAPYSNWLPYLLARVVGAVLGTVAVAFVMRIAWEIAGNVACLASGVSAAFYPGAIGMSVFLLSEALFCPLMLLCLYGTWRSIRSLVEIQSHQAAGIMWSNIRWSSLAGVAYGAACLARPSWSLWGFCLVLYFGGMVLGSWGNWRGRALDIGISLGVTAGMLMLTMSPWWVRNYWITDRFVPTTLQVGPSLYDGLHPGASGGSDEGMEFVKEFWVLQREQDQQAIERGEVPSSTYEWRLNRIMQRAAWEWVRENPWEAVRLAGVKFVKTWRPLPVAQDIGSPLIRYSEAVAYLGISILGGWGLWTARRMAGTWLFVLPSLYFSALHMVFVGSIRYRQPAVLVLCVLAGLGVCHLWGHLRERLRPAGSASILGGPLSDDQRDRDQRM